jgi:hypothetical protein
MGYVMRRTYRWRLLTTLGIATSLALSMTPAVDARVADPGRDEQRGGNILYNDTFRGAELVVVIPADRTTGLR